MKKTLVLLAVIMLIAASSSVFAVTYSGSLQYTPAYPADSGDGLFVGPSNLQWATYTVDMSWVVTNEDNSFIGYPWKYTYTFGHNGTQAAISHIIIEGSEGISENDITGITNATMTDIGPQTVLSGNPNMPEDLNGLRLGPATADPTSMTWSFWSNRAPVWGDFYAKCGGGLGGINFAYNYNKNGSTELGFVLNDVDPIAPASNGSVDFHILRPDTTVVPEPSSIIALICGIGGMGGMLLRKRSA